MSKKNLDRSNGHGHRRTQPNAMFKVARERLGSPRPHFQRLNELHQNSAYDKVKVELSILMI